MSNEKQKKPKAVPRDIVGREIKKEDVVVFSNHNTLRFARISKITPKKVRVVTLKGGVEYLKYQADVMLVNPKDATYYILTKC